jgi:hypothetical protein
MHGVSSILLAGILAVHSAGGLCWQCADMQASCPKTSTNACDCCCHEPADGPSDGRGLDVPEPACAFECTGTCRFLQPVRVSVEESASTPWVAILPLDESGVAEQSLFDALERSAIPRGGHPPMRLHLFHGLLLI